MDTGDKVNNVLTGRKDSPYKGSLNSELQVILKKVLPFLGKRNSGEIPAHSQTLGKHQDSNPTKGVTTTKWR